MADEGRATGADEAAASETKARPPASTTAFVLAAVGLLLAATVLGPISSLAPGANLASPSDAEGPLAGPAPTLAPDPNGTTTVDPEQAAGGNASGDLSLAIVGEPRPGGTVALAATIDGEPAADATVSLDGDAVGRTNASGALAISLPPREQVTVAVRQGDRRAIRRLQLADIRTSIEGVWFPGVRSTVRVTDGGEPVADAIVRADGLTRRTDDDGRVALVLAPWRGTTVEVTTRAGVTETTKLSPSPFPAIGLASLLLLGAVVVARRDAVAGDSLTLLVAMATRLEGAGTVIARAVRGDWAPLVAALENVPTKATSRHTPANQGSTATDDDPTDLRRAWRTLVERAPVEDATTATPGMVAGSAIDAGLPREPVERLVEAFRAVEYGGADPAEHEATANEVRRRLEREASEP